MTVRPPPATTRSRLSRYHVGLGPSSRLIAELWRRRLWATFGSLVDSHPLSPALITSSPFHLLVASPSPRLTLLPASPSPIAAFVPNPCKSSSPVASLYGNLGRRRQLKACRRSGRGNKQRKDLQNFDTHALEFKVSWSTSARRRELKALKNYFIAHRFDDRGFPDVPDDMLAPTDFGVADIFTNSFAHQDLAAELVEVNNKLGAWSAQGVTPLSVLNEREWPSHHRLNGAEIACLALIHTWSRAEVVACRAHLAPSVIGCF